MTDGRQYEDIYENASDDAPYTPVMRLRGVVERDRLDIAALIWMLCTLTTLGAQIWTAAHVDLSDEGFFGGPTTTKWVRVYTLSTTASFGAIVGASRRRC